MWKPLQCFYFFQKKFKLNAYECIERLCLSAVSALSRWGSQWLWMLAAVCTAHLCPRCSATQTPCWEPCSEETSPPLGTHMETTSLTVMAHCFGESAFVWQLTVLRGSEPPDPLEIIQYNVGNSKPSTTKSTSIKTYFLQRGINDKSDDDVHFILSEIPWKYPNQQWHDANNK